eukprot:gene22694-biopygen13302
MLGGDRGKCGACGTAGARYHEARCRSDGNKSNSVGKPTNTAHHARLGEDKANFTAFLPSLAAGAAREGRNENDHIIFLGNCAQAEIGKMLRRIYGEFCSGGDRGSYAHAEIGEVLLRRR